MEWRGGEENSGGELGFALAPGRERKRRRSKSSRRRRMAKAVNEVDAERDRAATWA